MNVLEVKNVSKCFGEIQAVCSVSFCAKKGEIIALLGPNGAGKSTLMNMVAGYLSPTSGNININNKDIKSDPLYAKKHTGFLPEGSPLYPDMQVKSFLYYMSELKGVSYEYADNAINISNLQKVTTQKIETLSKGYQRRVGFAQSILSSPALLLLDEPTDGLDPNQKDHIRKLIKEMGKDKSIIISTHLLEEAETIADRIILMSNGKIKADGTLENILQQTKCPNLHKAFQKLTLEDNNA